MQVLFTPEIFSNDNHYNRFVASLKKHNVVYHEFSFAEIHMKKFDHTNISKNIFVYGTIPYVSSAILNNMMGNFINYQYSPYIAGRSVERYNKEPHATGLYTYNIKNHDEPSILHVNVYTAAFYSEFARYAGIPLINDSYLIVGKSKGYANNKSMSILTKFLNSNDGNIKSINNIIVGLKMNEVSLFAKVFGFSGMLYDTNDVSISIHDVMAFNSTRFFVKDNSNKKIYEPFTCNTSAVLDRIFEADMSGVSSILHFMAPYKKITNEVRIICYKGEALTGSYYIVDGEIEYKQFDISEDIKWMVKRYYQKTHITNPIVMDFATIENENQWRFLESNCLSCSGLYECDTDLVIESVKDFLSAYD